MFWKPIWKCQVRFDACTKIWVWLHNHQRSIWGLKLELRKDATCWIWDCQVSLTYQLGYDHFQFRLCWYSLEVIYTDFINLSFPTPILLLILSYLENTMASDKFWDYSIKIIRTHLVNQYKLGWIDLCYDFFDGWLLFFLQHKSWLLK